MYLNDENEEVIYSYHIFEVDEPGVIKNMFARINAKKYPELSVLLFDKGNIVLRNYKMGEYLIRVLHPTNLKSNVLELKFDFL